jgi:hypothetical protein
MKRSNIILTVTIVAVTAMMFIPLGMGYVSEYTGSTESEESYSTTYLTMTINGGKYTGNLDKTIIYTQDTTVGGDTTYYPLNDSSRQKVENQGGYRVVKCGQFIIELTAKGNTVPESTLRMTLDSGTVNGELMIKSNINGVREYRTFNTVAGLEWTVPENVSGDARVVSMTTSVTLEVWAVVPVSTTVAPPAKVIDDATFGFKAEVTASDP